MHQCIIYWLTTFTILKVNYPIKMDYFMQSCVSANYIDFYGRMQIVTQMHVVISLLPRKRTNGSLIMCLREKLTDWLTGETLCNRPQHNYRIVYNHQSVFGRINLKMHAPMHIICLKKIWWNNSYFFIYKIQVFLFRFLSINE